MASPRFRAPSLALLACAALTLALAARAQEPGRAPAPPAETTPEQASPDPAPEASARLVETEIDPGDLPSDPDDTATDPASDG